jgi:hypothetical protein
MGRASVALGAPDSSAGIMDGSVIGTHLFDKDSSRSPSFGIDRVGQALSPATSQTASQQDAREAEKEVTRHRLWFQLPLDERAQFGSCFSRMLLKCLSDSKPQEQEV